MKTSDPPSDPPDRPYPDATITENPDGTFTIEMWATAEMMANLELLRALRGDPPGGDDSVLFADAMNSLLASLMTGKA